MRIDNSDWRRKHDDLRAAPLVIHPEAHFFPESREDLIDIVRRSLEAPQDPEVRACGSHWSLSHAAVTNRFIVETRGFAETDGFAETPFLNTTLYDVIPGCLSREALSHLVSQPAPRDMGATFDPNSYNYYHVEAGVRIFELYSRLDLQGRNTGDTTPPEMHMPTSRHPRTRDVDVLKGPWAMPTLGGAGGQTIVGAFSTGTHGGDQHQKPIADAVQAIHLIGPDANEYWIERGYDEFQNPLALTDDKALQNVYPGIQTIRDNETFNAVLVSVGRMGIIYSVVLRVVRQYGLRQIRSVDSWRTISPRLSNPSDPLFRSRFLQVVVNPHAKLADPLEHTCFVEQREGVGLASADTWVGRTQRTGANAGRNAPIGTSDFQSQICSAENVRPLVLGLLAAIHAGIAAINLAAGLAGPFGLFLAPILTAGLVTLAAALTPFLSYSGTLGELVADLSNLALAMGAPQLVAMVNEAVLSFGQPELPDPGRVDFSYAIMDFYNYLDRNCVASADSLTVCFNADESRYIGFMNTLFRRVNELEAGTLIPPPTPGSSPSPIGRPMTFLGYASLRFTARTDALIGMQRWERTCNIEIAGIKGIEGTDPFLRTLEVDAAALNATVHWGQKTEGPVAQVEATFPSLDLWRSVLARFTANGRLINFSTLFSRAKGLEVVQPRIGSFSVSPRHICVGEPISLSWDAHDNPRGTQLRLRVSPQFGVPTEIPLTDLSGTLEFRPPHGVTRFQLIVSYVFESTRRDDSSRDEIVTAFVNADIYHLSGIASCQEADGGRHWAFSTLHDEADWSTRLSPGNMYLGRGSRPLLVQKTGVPPVLLNSTSVGVEFLSSTGMSGEWLLHRQAEGCEGPVPELSIDIRLRCI
jgi:hypothetical protein